MTFSEASLLTKEQILKKLTTTDLGLNTSEVEKRREDFGSNTLSVHKTRAIDILLNQFKSSFIYLLLLAVAISLLLGEKTDAFIILFFVGINSVLGFWQEYKASISINSLRKFISKNSTVIRDGKELTIRDDEIVVGDILVLKAGDLIPAEVRFLSGNNIGVDESILTGESVSKTKTIEALGENIGFSGTLMTTGEAVAVVIAVGNNTELGAISKLALETETESGFSKEIAGLSKAIIWLMVGTLALTFILHILIKGSAIQIGELALFSIALAVGVVPEALPLVITISLSRGALRLAKKRVVPKRLSAIEDLGSIDILCTDKTGTITENKLTVTDFFPKANAEIVTLALCGTGGVGNNLSGADPFDKAIWEKSSQSQREEFNKIIKVAELPFDPVRRRNAKLIENNEQKTLIVRGAFEEICKLCTNTEVFESSELKAFIKNAENNGERILAIASKNVSTFEGQDLLKYENELMFEGVLVFSDPLKETAIEAVANAGRLGIQVKILTGDSPLVAQSIARAINLIDEGHKVLTGLEYESLNELEKDGTVVSTNVFARVSPQQKFDILRRLQKTHLVGFLGEGFNDAPGLKEAHVGLAVDNASDVAKESADIILLSKDLKTIVDGVEEGRKTFTNTVKYIRATLTSNFGNFFALAFSSLFIPFLPMLPIQILLVNLLTDTPMISISTDNVSEKNLKKPKRYKVKSILVLAALLGAISTIFDLATFFYFVRFGKGTLQTMWFMESVLTELVLLFSIRTVGFFIKSVRPSLWVIILTGVAGLAGILIPFLEVGRTFFGFVIPEVQNTVFVFSLVVTYFILTEVAKLTYYKLRPNEI